MEAGRKRTISRREFLPGLKCSAHIPFQRHCGPWHGTDQVLQSSPTGWEPGASWNSKGWKHPGTAEVDIFPFFFPQHFLCFQQNYSLTLHFTNQCIREQAARAALPGNWIAGNHKVSLKIPAQTAVLKAAREEPYLGSWKGTNCWENEEPSWYRDLGAIVFNLSLSLQ